MKPGCALLCRLLLLLFEMGSRPLSFHLPQGPFANPFQSAPVYAGDPPAGAPGSQNYPRVELSGFVENSV